MYDDSFICLSPCRRVKWKVLWKRKYLNWGLKASMTFPSVWGGKIFNCYLWAKKGIQIYLLYPGLFMKGFQEQGYRFNKQKKTTQMITKITPLSKLKSINVFQDFVNTYILSISSKMCKLHHFISKLTEYLDKLLKVVHFLQSFHSCKNLQNRHYFIIRFRCERDWDIKPEPREEQKRSSKF